MNLKENRGLQDIQSLNYAQSRTRLQRLRWGNALIWFMRVMALVWIIKGLYAWSIIMTIPPHTLPFEVRATGFQATIVYFAIFDLIAAVGLWLTSTWGGVMWLLAVISHIILAVLFPMSILSGPLMMAGAAVLIILYLTLSWLAAAEE